MVPRMARSNSLSAEVAAICLETRCPRCPRITNSKMKRSGLAGPSVSRMTQFYLIKLDIRTCSDQGFGCAFNRSCDRTPTTRCTVHGTETLHEIKRSTPALASEHLADLLPVIRSHETRALDNLIKEEPSAGGVGEGLVGETIHSRQHKGEQESAAVVGFAVVRVGFQLDRFTHGVLEVRESGSPGF